MTFFENVDFVLSSVTTKKRVEIYRKKLMNSEVCLDSVPTCGVSKCYENKFRFVYNYDGPPRQK